MRDPPDGFAGVDAHVLTAVIDDPTKRIRPRHFVGYARGHEIFVVPRIDGIVFVQERDVFRVDEPWERTVHAMPVPSVGTDVFRKREPHDGMPIVVLGPHDRVDGSTVLFAIGDYPVLDTWQGRGLHAVDTLP